LQVFQIDGLKFDVNFKAINSLGIIKQLLGIPRCGPLRPLGTNILTGVVCPAGADGNDPFSSRETSVVERLCPQPGQVISS